MIDRVGIGSAAEPADKALAAQHVRAGVFLPDGAVSAGCRRCLWGSGIVDLTLDLIFEELFILVDEIVVFETVVVHAGSVSTARQPVGLSLRKC